MAIKKQCNNCELCYMGSQCMVSGEYVSEDDYCEEWEISFRILQDLPPEEAKEFGYF